MISTHIKSADAAAPTVLGIFSYRYDAHLVPALIANIEPLVDGWVCYDDHDGDGVFSNELRRRRLLLEAARGLGARWALAVDPDERFESALAWAMPALAAAEGPYCYTFALREMYAERLYRVDGVWGEKRQARLLPLKYGFVEPGDQLHLPWSHFIPGHRLISTDFNLYHLKMITRARREARAALYKFIDPGNAMQTLNYDYLADDSEAVFELVPPGRDYAPPHVEDGGLWMADVSATS
jgi:hypothetical protein